MSYTPGPHDDWADWDTPTQVAPPRQRSASSGPLGVFGRGAAAQAPAARPQGRITAPAPAHKPPHRGRLRLAFLLIALALVVSVVAALVPFANRLMAFGSAISPQAPLSSQTGYMSGAGRVNVLVMGYGGAGWDGPYLTDSMMVISFVPGDKATTLISVPRDLWVQVPPNSGNYSKLNYAFEQAYYNGYNTGATKLPPGQLAGGMQAAAKVSEITGLNIPYFMTIDFQGFRELIDALGGIDVNVPRTIVLNYPPGNGWPKQFTKGMQHMNGLQALQYARARYVLSPASEGTDFARAARQQIIVHAVVDRMRNPSVWPTFSKDLTALQKTIYTNLSLADLSALTLKLDLGHAQHVGLTTSNVLVNAVSSDGQDILLPENGDWNAIKTYVSSHLKQ